MFFVHMDQSSVHQSKRESTAVVNHITGTNTKALSVLGRVLRTSPFAER